MPPRFVLGLMGSSPSTGAVALSTPAQLTALLNLAIKHNILDLDTARAYGYGAAEALLGSVDKSLTSRFRIDTKAPAFEPGSLSREKIVANCKLSLEALGEDKVHLYYLHGPDTKTPYQEKVDALIELHNQGAFEHWGVSNIDPDELRDMVAYCKSKRFITPKIYQGIYNPLHRSAEFELFPLLKELDMNFYAYSPLAGGIFAKPLERILAPEKGDRYDAMKFFGGMYLSNPAMTKGIRALAQACEANGLSMLEATIRWFKFHSGLRDGDGVILGASRIEQLEQSVEYVGGDAGKLSEEMARAFEELWDAIKEKALPYYFTAAAAKAATEKHGRP